MTALIWAAFHGEVKDVQMLVKKLSDINVVDEVSCTNHNKGTFTHEFI